MKRLDVLAADIKDLYYQDHVDSDEGFFDQDFFERQVQDAYALLMQDFYEKQYASLRSDNLHKTSMVHFDAEMVLKEKVSVEKGVVSLSKRIMSFKYDQSGCGVQDVQGDCDLIRIRYYEKHKLSMVEDEDEVFWWTEPEKGKTVLNFSKKFKGEVEVYYIPAGDPDLEIADSLADQIKRTILSLMWEAKKGGYPPDEINDGSKTIKQEQGN